MKSSAAPGNSLSVDLLLRAKRALRDAYIPEYIFICLCCRSVVTAANAECSGCGRKLRWNDEVSA